MNDEGLAIIPSDVITYVYNELSSIANLQNDPLPDETKELVGQFLSEISQARPEVHLPKPKEENDTVSSDGQ